MNTNGEKSIARANGQGWRVELLSSVYRGRRCYVVTCKTKNMVRPKVTQCSSLDFARTVFARSVAGASK